MRTMKKQKFKEAINNSSLFNKIDKDTLYREHKYIWDNARFCYHRLYSPLPNFTGHHIKTDENGFRQTSAYLKKGNKLPLKNIAVFGTSTMFGICRANELTVPSLLAKSLNEKDKTINYSVKNYAVGGYTSFQELLLFIEILERDPVDIAIFVDGASEFVRAYYDLTRKDNLGKTSFIKPSLNFMLQGIKNNSDLVRRMFGNEFLLLRKLRRMLHIRSFVSFLKRIFCFRGRLKKPTIFNLARSDIPHQVNRALSFYLKNKRIIENIANLYKITPLFVLEPLLLTKQQLSQEEENILRQIYGENKLEMDFIKKCVNTFQKEFLKHANAYDLTGLFNSNKTFFIDDHHTAENGNMVLADKLSEIIRNVFTTETRKAF